MNDQTESISAMIVADADLAEIEAMKEEALGVKAVQAERVTIEKGEMTKEDPHMETSEKEEATMKATATAENSNHSTKY